MRVKTKNIVLVLLTLGLSIFGCNKDKGKGDDELHDLILSNLLKNGAIDAALLRGDWDCIRFAYTTDGNTISDVTTLSTGFVSIQDVANLWLVYHTHEHHYDCLISSHLISLSLNGSTFVMLTPEEMDITYSLENAYGFVMKADELMIYFTGVDSKNLLILKKKNQTGDVPYKPCPCEFVGEPITFQGEARLFIDTCSTEHASSCMAWYNDREWNKAHLSYRHDDHPSMGISIDICNFPDFAKEWHSEEGIAVNYEGLLYFNEWCEQLSVGCRDFCGTLVLTKLMIQ